MKTIHSHPIIKRRVKRGSLEREGIGRRIRYPRVIERE